MVKTSRKLPKEWEKYEPIGKVIADTRMVVFKTPLSPQLSTKLPKSQHFTTQTLFRKIAETGKQIGMVINLTNTRRYYDKKEIEGMLIDYKEILCPGRGFIEREDLVKTFCKTVERFYEEYYDKDILLGIHCSNGINRCGYMICRYLIDSLGWNSHEAIEAFESARGYPIDRGSFISALHRAAKERRLRKKHRTEELSEDEEVSEKERRKRKKKRKIVDEEEMEDETGADLDNFDPALTAQMMQQFFAIQKQFDQARQVVESGQYAMQGNTSQSQSPYTPIAPNAIQVAPQASIMINVKGHAKSSQKASPIVSKTESPMNGSQLQGAMDVSAESSPYVDSQEYDEEEEEGDWSLNMDEGMDDQGQMSKSKARRERRKRREKFFNVMKRGKFYEIQEALQEQQERLANKP